MHYTIRKSLLQTLSHGDKKRPSDLQPLSGCIVLLARGPSAHIGVFDEWWSWAPTILHYIHAGNALRRPISAERSNWVEDGARRLIEVLTEGVQTSLVVLPWAIYQPWGHLETAHLTSVNNSRKRFDVVLPCSGKALGD